MYGYRNSQTTVLAPTGTIGLLMDCDTTGIEPDFALVKFKKLAGGGYFKIVNQSVPKALQNLGYTDAQLADIVSYVTGTNTFTGAPHCGRKGACSRNGLTEREIEKAEEALRGVFDVGSALAPWVIGTEAYERLEIEPEVYSKPGFHLLRYLGSQRQRDRRDQRRRDRPHDGRRRSAPASRAPPGVRLCEPLRQDRRAIPRADGTRPHDGGGAAVPVGRNLQDGESPPGIDHRGRRGDLQRGLEARSQGGRALPRRLEVLTNRSTPRPTPRAKTRTRRKQRLGQKPRPSLRPS